MTYTVVGELPDPLPDVLIAGRFAGQTPVHVGDVVQHGETRGVVVRVAEPEEYYAWCEKHYGHRPLAAYSQAIEVRFD